MRYEAREMHTYKVSQDKRHHRYRYQAIGYFDAMAGNIGSEVTTKVHCSIIS
jgi:hypothetical protein